MLLAVNFFFNCISQKTTLMKKITSVLLMISLVAAGFSQKKYTGNKKLSDTAFPVIKIKNEARFLLNVHTAYSMGLGSTFKFYPDDVSAIFVEQIGNSSERKKVSYANPSKGLGDGFKFGFGGSYILNDFINVGIDFDYFKSTIEKNRDSSYYFKNPDAGSGMIDEYSYKEKNTISYKATLLSITPSITFKAISRPKWFLYNRLGMVITFRPNSLQNDVTYVNTRTGWQGFYKDSASTTVKKYEWGIRNPAFGFIGTFGGQVKVSEKIRIFAEAQFSHIVFVIRKRTLTDFIVDKKHLENTFPVSIRELEFVKSFSTSYNNDPNRPSQTVIQRIPISYIGLQIGMIFQL
jgi:hypothetical protein